MELRFVSWVARCSIDLPDAVAGFVGRGSSRGRVAARLPSSSLFARACSRIGLLQGPSILGFVDQAIGSIWLLTNMPAVGVLTATNTRIVATDRVGFDLGSRVSGGY